MKIPLKTYEIPLDTIISKKKTPSNHPFIDGIRQTFQGRKEAMPPDLQGNSWVRSISYRRNKRMRRHGRHGVAAEWRKVWYPLVMTNITMENHHS